jgi:2-polyprenyl-6-methoxyphenol hydroxylase-like FAD-dependent oxidoreductase
MNRPLTIAGGGLAGLSLGIALRLRGVQVRLIEAASYPRHRVCGEFISGITERELDSLGIRDLFASAKLHTTTAWFDGERPMLSRTLPAPAYGLSRYFLDAELAERFTKLGGELHCGKRFDGDGEGVAWATGRMKTESEWIGLKAHFDNLALDADLEIHLNNGGYIGLTRVENDRVNVCGLFRRCEAVSGGHAVIAATRDAGLTRLAGRLSDARAVEGSLKGVSHFSLGWQRERDDDRVSIGDSAAMIPPFTGNGMTMAFQSALTATEPLVRWSTGEIEWSEASAEIRLAHRRRFSRRLGWAQMIQSLLLHKLGRKFAATLLALGVIRFETLYCKVR